jgi:hypothetical protein
MKKYMGTKGIKCSKVKLYTGHKLWTRVTQTHYRCSSLTEKINFLVMMVITIYRFSGLSQFVSDSVRTLNAE